MNQSQLKLFGIDDLSMSSIHYILTIQNLWAIFTRLFDEKLSHLDTRETYQRKIQYAFTN